MSEQEKMFNKLNGTDKYKRTEYYYAKEILRVTNTTIGFIDEEGLEQFITADEINYREFIDYSKK